MNLPDHLIEAAFAAAKLAGQAGDVPIGAVLWRLADGAILASAGNAVEQRHDPTAHAEILVIQQAAAQLGQSQLVGTALYSTLEPCTMCAGAIALARIDRLYYGAHDPKGGGVDHGARFFNQPTCHHRPDCYGGFAEARAAQLLRNFFKDKRHG